MYDYPSAAAANEHIRALRLEACRQHLVRVATCCQPSVVRRQSRAALTWLRTVRNGRLETCVAES
ncbi:MAG: hypothetical protein QOE99_1825 [Actinomycetota bacterium]|jgi:hypothetical protein|nr:hypothetical protein [Actinomycetota bacterium]MDT7548451.1 hypothetical protein [Actinomycetota bacterium]